jgi:hypothetical protein
VNEQEKRTVVINIDLTRGLGLVLVAILLLLAVIALVTWSQQPAVAQSATESQLETSASAGRRQYYITWDSYTPTLAIGACAEGYHFASLWEILDPSNLEYNSTLGWTNNDSGYGPPTEKYGWIRTGYNSEGGVGTGGPQNCRAWTSADGNDWGTQASLASQWAVDQDIHVWNVDPYPCNIRWPIWCVED